MVSSKKKRSREEYEKGSTTSIKGIIYAIFKNLNLKIMHCKCTAAHGTCTAGALYIEGECTVVHCERTVDALCFHIIVLCHEFPD